jgi:hypothetical protein
VATLFGKPADAAIMKKHAAYLEGFSLHAGVHLHANDREGLARLCGYGARPALSQDRLSELPDGRLAANVVQRAVCEPGGKPARGPIRVGSGASGLAGDAGIELR